MKYDIVRVMGMWVTVMTMLNASKSPIPSPSTASKHHHRIHSLHSSQTLSSHIPDGPAVNADAHDATSTQTPHFEQRSSGFTNTYFDSLPKELNDHVRGFLLTGYLAAVRRTRPVDEEHRRVSLTKKVLTLSLEELETRVYRVLDDPYPSFSDLQLLDYLLESYGYDGHSRLFTLRDPSHVALQHLLTMYKSWSSTPYTYPMLHLRFAFSNAAVARLILLTLDIAFTIETPFQFPNDAHHREIKQSRMRDILSFTPGIRVVVDMSDGRRTKVYYRPWTWIMRGHTAKPDVLNGYAPGPVALMHHTDAFVMGVEDFPSGALEPNVLSWASTSEVTFSHPLASKPWVIPPSINGLFALFPSMDYREVGMSKFISFLRVIVPLHMQGASMIRLPTGFPYDEVIHACGYVLQYSMLLKWIMGQAYANGEGEALEQHLREHPVKTFPSHQHLDTMW